MTNKFNPKVSIIIPVYNGSNFLKEAIESALAQTYRNIEIIVVNDGSTDNGATEQVALVYGNKIQYYSKTNGGTSTALNLGISHMTGDYFSWLSHDDMYYPNKISRQIEELEQLDNKNTIIMSDLRGINEKRQIIYKTDYLEHIKQYPPREKSYVYPIIYNKTHGCTLLIPKVCFSEVGLFDEKQLVAQDFEFFYRAFLKFPHKLIPEILVTARESSNRQGKSKKDLCDVEYSKLYITMIEHLSEEEIKLLAPDRLSFYDDMQRLFSVCDYTIASNYLNTKTIKNLQVSSFDLVGNKFNGHDLHNYLRQEGIDSKQVVLFKESKDINTSKYDFEKTNSSKDLLRKDFFLNTDIVHLHLVHNIFDLNYLPMMSRLKATVITLHDPFFLAGHCVHHFDCTKWKTHCSDCPYLNELYPLPNDFSALNFELKKQAVQNSDITAIVASKWLENKVRQSPIWAGKKVYLLPFGIDQEIFRPADKDSARRSLGLPVESRIIFFRSDPSSFKGLDIIKKAISSFDNTDNLVILTAGQTGLLNEFKSKCKIKEFGWIKNDQLLSTLYQACDIFLMPSRQETFGMMAIEAMSCGKTVLAIKGEGTALPDTINSPECGLAVDEKDFSSELKRLLDNPIEMMNRGNKSLDFARKHCSKEIYIQNMITIYKEVIANHHMDASSTLIMEQLKKHPQEKMKSKLAGTFKSAGAARFLGIIFDLKIFFMKLFRRLPIGLQRSIEPTIIKINASLRKYF